MDMRNGQRILMQQPSAFRWTENVFKYRILCESGVHALGLGIQRLLSVPFQRKSHQTNA